MRKQYMMVWLAALLFVGCIDTAQVTIADGNINLTTENSSNLNNSVCDKATIVLLNHEEDYTVIEFADKTRAWRNKIWGEVGEQFCVSNRPNRGTRNIYNNFSSQKVK